MSTTLSLILPVKGDSAVIDRIKNAARGQWIGILSHFGIDGSILDGKHHPCPKCGGTDRFRLIDADEGAVFCNQCFSQKNGDGIAAVQWFTDSSFQAATQQISEYLGLNGENGDGHQSIVEQVSKRKNIPLAAFREFGAHEARRGKLAVCRIPMYGPDGQQCSHFDMTTIDEKWLKGLSATGKPTGLFLQNGRVPEPGQTVLITEGVKDAAAISAQGHIAVGLPTKELNVKFAKLFIGCQVIIVPDRDVGGESGAKNTAARLKGIAHSVRISTLPSELKQSGGDGVREILKKEDGEKLLSDAIESASEWKPPPETSDEEPKKESQATKLVNLAVSTGVELFHTPGSDGRGYATIPVGGHHETWRLGTRGFKLWLRRLFWEQSNKSPNSQALQDAMGVLEGMAIFDGQEHETAVRISGDDNCIYVDLANEAWQAVKITAAGFEVIDNQPVKFVRPRGVLPLPIPESGGTLDELRPFINVADEQSFVLLVGWMVMAFRPSGPYPLLQLNGEQGSAKSTACRVARLLIDPNESALRSEPREARDLMIAATNGWVVALENLSSIPVWLSDALCSLSTGGSFATRQLFSNDEEALFTAMRPVVMNGINEVATRSDLMDRAVSLTLPAIPDENRLPEREFWNKFESAKGRLFGALLDAVSMAIRNLPSVSLTEHPRMADFAEWAQAAEPMFGCPPGTFVAAYAENRSSLNEVAVESSRIAAPLLKYLDDLTEWTGTATELLDILTEIVGDRTAKQRDWPKRPHLLSGQLRRIAPNLRKMGIDVQFCRAGNKGRQRIINIRMSTQNSVQSVQSVQSSDSERPPSVRTVHPASTKTPEKQGENGEVDAVDAVDAQSHTLSKEENAVWTA